MRPRFSATGAFCRSVGRRGGTSGRRLAGDPLPLGEAARAHVASAALGAHAQWMPALARAVEEVRADNPMWGKKNSPCRYAAKASGSRHPPSGHYSGNGIGIEFDQPHFEFQFARCGFEDWVPLYGISRTRALKCQPALIHRVVLRACRASTYRRQSACQKTAEHDSARIERTIRSAQRLVRIERSSASEQKPRCRYWRLWRWRPIIQ